jgi:hypothetical protein
MGKHANTNRQAPVRPLEDFMVAFDSMKRGLIKRGCRRHRAAPNAA